MPSAATLVARLRADSRLSQRALATRAGCTRSTIVRIEAGEMDPTVTMLTRIAAATGHHLSIEARPQRDANTLASVAARFGSGHEAGIDWTHLRAVIDWLRLHPDHTLDAINDPPARTGDARLDNLLAAVAEKLADDSVNPRPMWTAAVPVLGEPWEAPGTPRMRAAEFAAAPTQFRARNILLGADNLWRRRG